MTLSHKLTALLALPVLMGYPLSTFASVQITEVMYDVPGSDTGREWIEITNSGSTSVDISGYKLFEGDTNHTLVVVSGLTLLAAGSSAVIVEDSAKFNADWPNVTGSILKASFSLSNTGETLALKDSALVQVDQVTYASTTGAAGDGNSLHRSGNTFVVGGADPGVFSTTVPTPIEDSNTTPSVQPIAPPTLPTASSQAGSAWPPVITSKITTDPTVIVGGGSFFTGVAYGLKGEKIANARYIWNFGDGSTDEGQNVFHTYTYPGKYAVMLSVGAELSSAVGRVTVQAVPAQLALMTESDGSVVLVNRAGQELSVGLWSITSGTTTFVLPQGTSVLAGQSVRFAPSIMKMHAGADSVLQYPNGANAVVAVPHEVTVAPVSVPESIAQKPAVSKPFKIASRVVLQLPEPTPEPTTTPEQEQVVIPSPGVFLPFSEVPTSVVPVPQLASKKPHIEAASEISAEPAAVAGASAASGHTLTVWEGMLGLIALVLVGLSGVWYSQSLVAGPQPVKKRNSFSVDEFEIEE